MYDKFQKRVMVLDLVALSAGDLAYGSHAELVGRLGAWLGSSCLLDVPLPVLGSIATRLDAGNVVLVWGVDVVLLPVPSDVYVVADADSSSWVREEPIGPGAVA